MTRRQPLQGINAFYALFAGQLVSTIGSGMTRFGLSVWVLVETGDTAAYTTLLFFAVFPAGIGSFFAGPLIDRWDRRRVMITANVVASLSTLGIALLYFTGALAAGHLYMALAINGVANAFISPSLQSSTPLLVPKEKLNRASGLNQLIRSVEMILAPGLAGFVVGSFGLGAIFVIDFLTFGASILALLLSNIPQPTRTTDARARTSFWRDLAFGFQYIRQRPPFIYLLALFAITMFLLPGVGYSLVTPLVLSFETEEVLGLVLAAYGVGSILGGILLAVWSGKHRRMHGILAAMAVAGLAAILIGLSENAWIIAAGLFVTGISFVFMVGLNRVILQIKSAPDVQGRIFSLQMAIGVTAQAAGILTAGPLSSNVFEPMLMEGGPLAQSVGAVIGAGAGRGIAFLFMVLGLLELLIVLVSSLMPRVRLLEDELPDYEIEGDGPRGAAPSSQLQSA